MTTTAAKTSASYNAPRYTCPHCADRARCRTSRALSPLTQELYLQCLNVHCGHTWKSMMSAVHTLVPSQTPNPSVFLPKKTPQTHHMVDSRQTSFAI
jgi:hypothetical protein